MLVNASITTFEGNSASIAVVVDVTERNKAQRQLATTAAILATEHESSPDGILVVDPTARIISVNRRFGQIFDIPTELLEAGDDGPVRAMVLQRMADKETFQRRVKYLYDHTEESGQDELVLKNGRVLDRYSAPFKASSGEYMGRIWFFSDITERRKAEEALRAGEERFRLLIEEAPDAILLLDCDQDRFISANKAAERLFGVSREQILKQGLQHFYTPQQGDARPVAQSFWENGKRALGGEQVIFERRIRRASGEERLCQVNSCPASIEGAHAAGQSRRRHRKQSRRDGASAAQPDPQDPQRRGDSGGALFDRKGSARRDVSRRRGDRRLSPGLDWLCRA